MEHYSANVVKCDMNSVSKEAAIFNQKQALIIRVGLIQLVILLLLVFLLVSCKNRERSQSQSSPAAVIVNRDTAKALGYRVDNSYIPIASHHPEDIKQKLRELELLKFEKITLGDQVLDYLKKGENDFGDEFKFIELRFETKSFEINDKFAHEFQDLATIMKAFPNMKVEFSVYTDGAGEEKANEKLTDERGKTVKSKLVMAGVEENRISYKAYGEKYPVADNKTYEGKSINNRIEMIIQSK